MENVIKHKEFIQYHLAVAAKNHGFDEDSDGAYYKHWKNLEPMLLVNQPVYEEYYDLSSVVIAPTYQQMIDWFRERYGLHLFVVPIHNKTVTPHKMEFLPSISSIDKDNYTHSEPIEDYYDALNICIEEAFKLI